MRAPLAPRPRPARARPSAADANSMLERAARLKLPGLIVAMSLNLAGCAGLDDAPMVQGARAQGASENPGIAASTPAGAGASAAGAFAPGATAPADLVGLDGPSLEHLLGKPGLVRRDYPAEVWQYRNPSCVLDVYLYPDDERLTVTHAEARGPKMAGDALRPCIAKLAELKHKATG